MNFIIMILALTVNNQPDPQFNQFGYPTAQFRDEVKAALLDGVSRYQDCAKKASSSIYKGTDAAPIIAEAAIDKCSEMENLLIELNANYIAIETSISSGFEFKMMVNNAQIRREELWKPLRDKIKSSVITYVLELRAKRK